MCSSFETSHSRTPTTSRHPRSSPPRLVEDLEAALAQFAEITASLSEGDET